MTDRADPDPREPEHRPTDARVEALRDRAVDLIAGASVHAEQINAAARKLGLTPDLLDGVGDQLYEAAVAQLDVASKILERSQAILDRLFEIGARREPSQLTRLDVTRGQPASLHVTVRNPSQQVASVSVGVEWDAPDLPIAARIGRRELRGGRETSVEVAIPTDRVEPGKVYAGTVTLALVYETVRRVELPRRDFEVWVIGD